MPAHLVHLPITARLPTITYSVNNNWYIFFQLLSSICFIHKKKKKSKNTTNVYNIYFIMLFYLKDFAEIKSTWYHKENEDNLYFHNIEIETEKKVLPLYPHSSQS